MMLILINIFVIGATVTAFFIELNYDKQPGWLWFFGISTVVNLGILGAILLFGEALGL